MGVECISCAPDSNPDVGRKYKKWLYSSADYYMLNQKKNFFLKSIAQKRPYCREREP